MDEDRDDLFAWIADLQARVARGELNGRGTFRTGRGELPVELAARIMLADVDHDKDLTPEQRHDSFSVERRRVLFGDLHRLREQSG